MNQNAENLPKLMGTNLRITSAVIFCIGVHVIIPKITNTTSTFGDVKVNAMSVDSDRSTTNNQGSKGTYIPPNYGGPNSMYGSGTR